MRMKNDNIANIILRDFSISWSSILEDAMNCGNGWRLIPVIVAEHSAAIAKGMSIFLAVCTWSYPVSRFLWFAEISDDAQIEALILVVIYQLT